MSVLPAQMIRRRCKPAPPGWGGPWSAPLITPFVERGVVDGLSYGLSGCGYDVRIKDTVWLWPFWRRLGVSIERFNVPADLRGKIENKSTWVRRGVDASLTTNMEPGWCGNLTIEMVRHLPWPIRIKAGTPILQVVFEELVEATEQPYGAVGGKYQDQPARPVPAIRETER